MIGYITLGTNDLDRAAAFYDALLGEMGATRMMESERMVVWTTGPTNPAFSVMTPYDEKEACVGNGVMIALTAKNTEQVDALYAKALELGGTDEGAPGTRNGGFYLAYFRDLDGNKLNFFCMPD